MRHDVTLSRLAAESRLRSEARRVALMREMWARHDMDGRERHGKR